VEKKERTLTSDDALARISAWFADDEMSMAGGPWIPAACSGVKRDEA